MASIADQVATASVCNLLFLGIFAGTNLKFQEQEFMIRIAPNFTYTQAESLLDTSVDI